MRVRSGAGPTMATCSRKVLASPGPGQERGSSNMYRMNG